MNAIDCPWQSRCSATWERPLPPKNPRSDINNDPNREDEPDYIVNLTGKVITVSLETQKWIAELPPLELPE